MTSPARPGRRTRPLSVVRVFVVAALTAVGLLVFGAVTASAAGLPDGQTHVGVSTPETIFPVGAFDGSSAAQGRAPPVSQPLTVVATGVTAESLAGSGSVPGVLEASSRVKSFGVLRNYYPKNSVEYVFDPETDVFAVGRPAASAGLKGSPHEQLAQSIGADPSTVVGGTLTRGSDGVFETMEMSGHYWQNWTPGIRQQFVDAMRGYGFDVAH